MRMLTAGLVLSGVVAAATGAAGHNVNVHWRDQDRHDCSSLEVTFDGDDAAKAEQQLTIPASSGTISMVAPRNGGIYMRGAERRDVQVTVCKAASTAGGDKGAGLLSRIVGRVANGSVRVEGPDDRDWVAYLLVDAPAGISVQLGSQNGPVEVRDFSGTVRAETTNGPVHLLNVRGDIRARAQNGPIGFTGQGGTVDLTTQNGPIQVRLAGTKWEAGGLTARAENGPMQLDVPDTYGSTVHLESSEHSPWSCKGAACERARKTWDTGTRSLELGDGPAMVRLTTVNGPIQVRSGSERSER
jgi:hypothetical protein